VRNALSARSAATAPAESELYQRLHVMTGVSPAMMTQPHEPVFGPRTCSTVSRSGRACSFSTCARATSKWRYSMKLRPSSRLFAASNRHRLDSALTGCAGLTSGTGRGSPASELRKRVHASNIGSSGARNSMNVTRPNASGSLRGNGSPFSGRRGRGIPQVPWVSGMGDRVRCRECGAAMNAGGFLGYRDVSERYTACGVLARHGVSRETKHNDSMSSSGI